MFRCLLFVNVTATTYIYTYVHTLSLNDALPILVLLGAQDLPRIADGALDFVINIASFQEMSREQVSAYLDVIDRKASGLLYTQQLWSSGTHAYELGEIRGWEDYPWPAHWSQEQKRSAVWSDLYFEVVFKTQAKK